MRRGTSYFVGAALALGLALPVYAQQGQPSQPDMPNPMGSQHAQVVMGKIVGKDETNHKFTVQTDQGQRLTLLSSTTTQFRSDQGETTDLNDLQIGDRVIVQTKAPMSGAGEQTALSVQVQPKSGAPLPPGPKPGTTSPQSSPSEPSLPERPE